jgi:two-component system, chemotaxis family, sensor histidine kinase and response regulator WspE
MTDLDTNPVLKLFHSEIRDAMAVFGQGVVALETNPTDRQPMDSIIEAARNLRGSCRLMGFDTAAELLATIETYTTQTSHFTLDQLKLLQCAIELLGRLETAELSAVWAEETQGERTVLLQQLGQSPMPVQAPPLPLPPPTPAPPPPAPSPSRPQPKSVGPESLHIHIEPEMLELFQEEVRSHTNALAAELVELERFPTEQARIDRLMRAAHSLKGASRILGVDVAVGLAHDMEDVFVSVQAGSVALTSAGIDILLAATDTLMALGSEHPEEWSKARRDIVAQLRNQIVAIIQGEQLEDRPAVVSPVEPTTPTPQLIQPTPSHAETPQHPVPVTSSAIAVEPSEAVVRVTAESLTRLMSLAGESLVQARWLQPFASSLHELKKVLDQIATHLDIISHSVGRDSPVRGAVSEARSLSSRGQHILVDRIGEFETHAGQAEDLNTRLYREVIVSRMRPFADGTHGFARLVRDTARMLGKKVRLEVLGKDTEVDRDILERLEAPLTHLLRNAVDHGIESEEVRIQNHKPAEGAIRLEALHRCGMLSITISDDGGGIDIERLRSKVVDRGHATPAMASRMTDAELLEFLFLPGFSTASKVTEISGRGVGLDVVQDIVRKVGGTVQIKSSLHVGTTFHLLLPLTLSVVRAVLVEVGGDPYAFPHNRIDRLIRVSMSQIRSLQGRQHVTVDDRSVGLVLASQLFDVPPTQTATDDLTVMLLSDVTGTYGLVVDRIRGEQDLVVRPLDSRLGKLSNISAAAIMDDGSPVFIADVEDLIRSMDQYIQSGTLRRYEPEAYCHESRKRILVVDDSITVREVQRQILRGHGYDVEVAVDGVDGWNKLQSSVFDLVVSDVDMPRMTGLEMVRLIRQDSRYQNLPIVIVSYKDRHEDRLRGLEAGANQYLVKSSFHDDSFVETISELIGS